MLTTEFIISGVLLLFAIAIGVYLLLRLRFNPNLKYQNREEWVRGYLQQNPQALPLQVIGAYNAQRELGKQWGFFSLKQMEFLIAKIKSGSDSSDLT